MQKPTLEHDDDSSEVPTARETSELYVTARKASHCSGLPTASTWHYALLLGRQHYDPYARASCRRICHKIMKRLPQEMRDIIYENLLSGERQHVFASSADTNIQWDAHYFETGYVGTRMLRELIEYRYRSIEIHFDQDMVSLGRFLCDYVDGVGVPRGQLIKKISIMLNQKDISTSIVRLADCVPSFVPRKRLLKSLEHLFLLRRGASIRFYLSPSNYRAQGPENILEGSDFQEDLLQLIILPIFAILRRLKGARYSIATGVAGMDGRAWPSDATMYHLEDSQSVSTRPSLSIRGDLDLVWRQVQPISKPKLG
ncbi:hypothetical protein CC86DRAFT_40823 [Ophiobolus disseminans]|uniref:Uncharacterized protein n=1 Tax=Ophiobolus disseminans TaxID=1469910 RepID=A0A6A6ZWK4_9PLEO|nr:hypothetical protein CC86DRAFT_40823 [Ophiobolus disseminans]